MPAGAIINGTTVQNDDFAFVGRFSATIIAGDNRGKSEICTAALIDDNWAITARHCFGSIAAPKGTEIVFNRRRLSDSGVSATVEAFLVPAGGQDVLLLKLDHKVPGIEPAHPIAPWDSRKWQAKTKLSTAGWGDITLDGRGTDELRRAEHVVVNAYGATIRTSPAPGEHNHWAFHGDSGAPLVYREPNGQWTLVGVFSEFSGGQCFAGACFGVFDNRWVNVGNESVAGAIDQAFKAW